MGMKSLFSRLSPGAEMIQIEPETLNPQAVFVEFEKSLDLSKSGACTQFIGYMRDFNDDLEVQTMTLEHYPGMTEKALQKIEDEARGKWSLNAVLIVHRVGPLKPSDPIVLVAAWSAHRNEAFLACRYLIEELKHRAPFWKKELTDTGERWVAENTPVD